MKKSSEVVIKNCNENNLKNISLSIPRGSFTVITGVSGSGKSSLAFGCIFKEGQRRYLASLPSYARQFMPQMDKPDVESIEGLSPTVSIDQKTSTLNPRSTVGTVTGIYDFMRLLYSRLSVVYCPNGHGPISHQSQQSIADNVLEVYEGKLILVMAPIVMDRKGSYRKELSDYREAGFRRARVNGEVVNLSDTITLDRYKKHTIEVVMDYFLVEQASLGRLSESILKAMELSKSWVSFEIYEKEGQEYVQKNYQLFSTDNSCAICGYSVGEIEPRLFSFNAIQGMCPHCDGLGSVYSFDVNKLHGDPNKPLFKGGLNLLNEEGNVIGKRVGRREIEKIAKAWKVDLEKLYHELPTPFKDRVITGSDRGRDGVDFSLIEEIEGYIGGHEESKYFKRYLKEEVCSVCKGTRLREITNHIYFKGKLIHEMASLGIDACLEFFKTLRIEKNETKIAEPIVKEIVERLHFLRGVGLEYLNLARKANTLSGGESQRIRLAAQIGSGLEGCLYILDEPSIGLHQSDNRKLIDTLKLLRDKKNTVYVIEHDEDTILSADHLVDIGPLAGKEGGEVVYNGHPSGFLKKKSFAEHSMTVAYMLGYRQIEALSTRRVVGDEKLILKGVKHNNIKGIDVSIPLGVFNVVVGVSGSGKSTLINRVLVDAFTERTPSYCKELVVEGTLDKLIEIDQKPIGRTPRSNLATYTKAMDIIRDLFVGLKESRIRSYKKGRFSFNVKGGRCEYCGGAGVIEVETQIFSSNTVVCEYCDGKRFNDETLEIHYKGKSVSDVLNMTVEEALIFFKDIPRLYHILETIYKVGLGYIRLGQPSTTFSGGEAQRIKLASELSKTGTGKTLYIFDEPTTGLHLYDIEKLVKTLQELVNGGNTLVVIEHNMDVIKCADYVIEMGPKGGEGGGNLIFSGTTSALSKADTPTGREVAHFLERDEKRRKGFFKEEQNFKTLLTEEIKTVEEVEPIIKIRNLVKNNLKNIDLDIPKNKLITVTGLSGSGKTSLAFDTIFQEGQRRYIESLSTYARRFLGRIPRPKADLIEGITPTIAIDQKRQGRNPRSTVATQTEIYDHLRVIYSNIAHPHCPVCKKELRSYDPSAVVDAMVSGGSSGKSWTLCSLLYDDNPLKEHYVVKEKDRAKKYLNLFQEKGFLRVRMDGQIVKMDDLEDEQLGNFKRLELVVDRLSTGTEMDRSRWIEGVEKAYEISGGFVCFHQEKGDVQKEDAAGESRYFSERPLCFEHGELFENGYSPRNYSFNQYQGYCQNCHGLGVSSYLSADKIVASPTKPLAAGALHRVLSRQYNNNMSIESYYLKKAGKKIGIDVKEVPYNKLTEEQKNYFLYGSKESEWEGIEKRVERLILLGRLDEEECRTFMVIGPCRDCGGQRLNRTMRSMLVGGENISEICSKNAHTVLAWCDGLDKMVSTKEKEMIADILEEMKQRISSIEQLGLSYLTLDRTMDTVSGGEAQRIRLATQIGNKLKDVIYVLDEPTIGLHDKDTEDLIVLLKELRDRENTVLLVEHDELVIKSSDWIIDVGPKAGRFGGKIMYNGPYDGVTEEVSFYPYLHGASGRDVRQRRDGASLKDFLVFKGLSKNNLKNVTYQIPLGALVGVSGVSGAGKSSLIDESVELVEQKIRNDQFDRVTSTGKGPFPIESLLFIDQSPVSRSSRSTLVSYMGFFDIIRVLFSQTKMSKERGYTPSYFSYNSKMGACQECGGIGYKKVEMHFIADVEIACEACGTKRYQKTVLEVYRNSKNIGEVLEMTVEEAYDYFGGHNNIQNRLGILKKAGLSYLTLGSSLGILSGGELQRLKIAYELSSKKLDAKTLYILDEPTTGLHFKDVVMLLEILDEMVKRGATVVTIEHNNLFLRNCDYLIDIGPSSGENGGEVVNFGSLEDFKKNQVGSTWKYL